MRVKDVAERERARYAGDANRPLGTYLGAMGVYATAVGGIAAYVRAKRLPLPTRLDPWDVGLVALATHKLSRLVAKDTVTSPLRAPFTRFKGQSGPGELAEDVREEPTRKGVGELLTCPFCVGQWVATGFVGGLVIDPQVTRLVAATFAALAGADLLQFAYAAAEQAAEG